MKRQDAFIRATVIREGAHYGKKQIDVWLEMGEPVPLRDLIVRFRHETTPLAQQIAQWLDMCGERYMETRR